MCDEAAHHCRGSRTPAAPARGLYGLVSVAATFRGKRRRPEGGWPGFMTPLLARAGRTVNQCTHALSALIANRVQVLVVDEDPMTIRRLRRAGVPCIYGDASNPTVLEQTRLDRARVLAITTSDLAQAQAAVVSALQINPRLDVIVRGADVEGHFPLREAGAAEWCMLSSRRVWSSCATRCTATGCRRRRSRRC